MRGWRLRRGERGIWADAQHAGRGGGVAAGGRGGRGRWGGGLVARQVQRCLRCLPPTPAPFDCKRTTRVAVAALARHTACKGLSLRTLPCEQRQPALPPWHLAPTCWGASWFNRVSALCSKIGAPAHAACPPHRCSTLSAPCPAAWGERRGANICFAPPPSSDAPLQACSAPAPPPRARAPGALHQRRPVGGAR